MEESSGCQSILPLSSRTGFLLGCEGCGTHVVLGDFHGEQGISRHQGIACFSSSPVLSMVKSTTPMAVFEFFFHCFSETKVCSIGMAPISHESSLDSPGQLECVLTCWSLVGVRGY